MYFYVELMHRVNQESDSVVNSFNFLECYIRNFYELTTNALFILMSVGVFVVKYADQY